MVKDGSKGKWGSYQDEWEKMTGASEMARAWRWAAWLVWERSIILSCVSILVGWEECANRRDFH